MRRNRPERLSPFALGLLAILGIAIFVYAAFAKRAPLVPRYEVRAVFSSSNQLREGNPVRIAGVDVGKVVGIDPGPGTTQIVTMTIDEQGRPVHADATVKIRPRVFLEGGYFVELHPGSPRGRHLGRGDTIPLPQTAVPVQFHQVLGAFDRPTRAGLQRILAEFATGLDGGGAEGIRRAIRPLAPTLRDVARVSEASRGTTPGDLARLVDSAGQVFRVLAAREGDLRDAVTGLNRTTAALAADETALAASVRELDELLAATPLALAALDRATPSVRRFAVALRPGLRVAPPVFDRTADLLVQLDGLARAPDSPSDFLRLVVQLRPVLPELPRLALLARGLFPYVGPLVTCLQDNLVPTLNAKLDDGRLSTGRPVWQELLHAFAGFAGGSQNFDANGPWVRYLVGGGPDSLTTGSVPGVGTLTGSTSEPILGARPVWRGTDGFPPFRPDQDCRAQAPPDLRAEAGLPGGGG